jgi:DNA-binding MarR family transcriptional regulator
VAALLAFLQREPELGRVLVVEALGAGPRTLEHRRLLLAGAADAIDRDGRAVARGEGPPPLVAEGALGGALSVIHERMAGAGRSALADLLNPLVSMIVLPYLGPAAARAELERPVAPASANGDRGRAAADPLRGLNMRLTYRTVRVLLSIAEHPGASNREIADGASIRDQGQISKLLTRLQHVGLIENAREGQAKGMPNSWTLTPTGRNVSRALSLSADG